MLPGVCATRAVLTDAANEAAATADRFAGLPLKERLRALAKVMGTKKSGANSLAVKRTAVGPSTTAPATPAKRKRGTPQSALFSARAADEDAEQ